MSGKARRGRGEGSVYQDTKGVWHAKLNLGRYKNGKRRFKEFQGKRKADVIARRDVYLREHGDLSLEPGANMSFADYITRWLENVKRNEQKEATHNRAVSTAKTYIIPMIPFPISHSPLKPLYFNGLFSISVTCRKISPTTLLTNPYILTIINRDNYQGQLQGGNMTTENMKALLDACYQAKRVRELLPALPKGVSPSYIHYLDTIEELERRGVRVKVSDISDALNLPRPGVTRTVKEMEDKGYLKKIASEQDGRVTYLSITESGRQLSQVHNTEFFAQLAPLVADISDADAACTVQTIEKIYKIMSERKNSLEHR